MRLLLIGLAAFIFSTSAAQITLVTYKPAQQNEAKKVEQNIWQLPKSAGSEEHKNKLFQIEEKLQSLKLKNDDLLKENEELKKALLTLQINNHLSFNLPNEKKVVKEINAESIYDY